jgi:hypothetical protein
MAKNIELESDAAEVRGKIRKLVKEYHEATRMPFGKIYYGLYSAFEGLRGVDLEGIGGYRKKGTSLLRVAEDFGYLDILYDTACEVLQVKTN